MHAGTFPTSSRRSKRDSNVGSFLEQRWRPFAEKGDTLSSCSRSLQGRKLSKEQTVFRPSITDSSRLRASISLRKVFEEKLTKEGVIGIGIAVTAVGLVSGGIVAALSLKK